MFPIRRPDAWAHPVHRRRLNQVLHVGAWLCVGLLAGVIAACGGGGSSAVSPAAAVAVGSGTAALSQGPIAGFGSVIVNGARFDDSAASVEDGDGNRLTPDALRLGMMVQIESTALGGGSSAKASAVRFGNQVRGPVEAVNASAGTLVVLGQTIDVATTTVFDGITGGLAGVAVGALVDAHGLPDAASGHIAATRIEAETALASYKLRGIVAALDTTAKTFSIGAAALSYAGLASVPAALANGATVRTTLATAQSGGRWVVTSMRVEPAKPADHAEAHLRGNITAFTSTTQFSVNGIAVDASAASFPDGTTGLALGARVEVQGSIAGGVLVAAQVALDARHAGDDRHQNELHGAITSIDITAKTFVLRGLTVSYAGTVTYSGGSEATLAVGAKVGVKGRLTSGGTIIEALSIRFES